MSQNKNYIAIGYNNEQNPSMEIYSYTRSKKIHYNANSVKFDNTNLTNINNMRFCKSDTILIVIADTNRVGIKSAIFFRFHGTYNLYFQQEIKAQGYCYILPNYFETEK
eukprot:Mrub_04410.p1 GENE.Mrub_04410~~Mrub_04410.p1  ORF type:complete len:125 (-),score=1.98 Mrub_04410:901-1227(-)